MAMPDPPRIRIAAPPPPKIPLQMKSVYPHGYERGITFRDFIAVKAMESILASGQSYVSVESLSASCKHIANAMVNELERS